MDTPFKMKGSPFQRNFGIGSPVKRADVLITQDEDGERKTTVHKGKDAYTKGRLQERKTSKAWQTGDPGTEEERATPEYKETVRQRQTQVDYTGDDASKKTEERRIQGKIKNKDARRMQSLISDGLSYEEALSKTRK